MFPIRDHNPSGRTPYVTYALIAANIAVFLAYWPFLPNDMALAYFYDDWGMVPARVIRGSDWYTILTSMFLHGGWMHLAGNMLFLWIFGDNLEDMFGHIGFLLFYLASGTAAAILQITADPGSYIPMVGASGAIAGVMGGYLLMFPRARVDVLIIIVVFFRIIPFPAWVMLAVWFGLQLLNGVVSDPNLGGVAYWAHTGGFLAGLILAIPAWLRRGGPRFWSRTHGQPPHPVATYTMHRSSVPKIRRRR